MKRILLSLLLVLPLLAAAPAPASAAGKDVFEIYTVSDLLEFADAISHTAGNYQAGRQSAILMRDLDLSGVEWACLNGAEMIDGRVVWGYNGTFDGNGHTISNLNGLFSGTLGEDGVIRDLTLKNVTLEMTDGYAIYAGGLVNHCYGTVENCHVSGDLIARNVMNVGGITGCVDYDASVTNCTSDMTITLQVSQTGVDSFGYIVVGGIAGMNNGLVDGCFNDGDISVTGLNCGCGSTIGGVVGLDGFGSDGLRNSGNTGDIAIDLRVPNDQSSADVQVGGIAGQAQISGNVRNCFTTGSITGSVRGESVLCGTIGSYLPGTYYREYYENCWSTGAASMTSDVSGTATAQYFRTDASSTLYYLNEAAAVGGRSGQYIPQGALLNGDLVDTLNRNLAQLKDPTLRMWEQGRSGPTLSDKTWDATFQPVEKVGFVDLKAGAYYEAAVNWAVKNQITSGLDATHFGPEALCTRAQVGTFLWRANGSPEPVEQGNRFLDVSTGDYFLKPVLWAVEENITTGVSERYFGPNRPCTRAQVVTFLWRAAGEPTPVASANPFSDVKPTDYYAQAVLWAVEQNITNGVDAAHFAPDASCTRGQIVAFLYRAMGG